MTSFRADWLFTGESEPIRDGLLCVNNGRIEYAGPRNGQAYDVDFQSSLIIPGLVNAHTHLDLCGLRQLGTRATKNGETFTSWLKEVIAYRRASTPQDRAAAIRAGIHESLSAGTTLLADISVGGESLSALQQAPLRSVVYLELLGLSDDAPVSTLRSAEAWLTLSPQPHFSEEEQGGVIRLGLSPHAPYSIHQNALTVICRLASEKQAPVAMHLAETLEELQLLESHAGPFRDFLEEFGVWHPENLVPSLDWPLFYCGLSPSPLLIHGNYLQIDQIKNLPAHSSVAYCPRTHDRFSQSEHPYRTMLDCGMNVALGTDSLASNPDLSILHEARFLWQRDKSCLAPHTLLAMATINGAAALGVGHIFGTLSPGKYADFVVLPCANDARKPWEELWASGTEPIALFVGGEPATDQAANFCAGSS